MKEVTLREETIEEQDSFPSEEPEVGYYEEEPEYMEEAVSFDSLPSAEEQLNQTLAGLPEELKETMETLLRVRFTKLRKVSKSEWI